MFIYAGIIADIFYFIVFVVVAFVIWANVSVRKQKKKDEEIQKKRDAEQKSAFDYSSNRIETNNSSWSGYSSHQEPRKNKRFYTHIFKSKPLKQYANFVTLDTETTGLSSGDVVIEIGLAKYRHYKLVDTFTTLIDPQMPIPGSATKINGITNQMVAGEPIFDEIKEHIIDFIGEGPIIGHNLSFDLRMLEQSGLGKGTFDDIVLYDTVIIARKHAGAENNKLETLCAHYNIDRDTAHRALSDCIDTAMVFMCLVEQVTGKQISNYQKQALAKVSIQDE